MSEALSGMVAISNAGQGGSSTSDKSVVSDKGVASDNGAADSGSNTWFSPDFAAMVQAKGWQTPNDVLTSYKNLETLLGEKATAIVPPKPDASPEDWGKFYERLGRPADPSMYKFNKEGMDPKLAPEVGKWFHAIGLNDKQADTLVKQYSDFQKTYQAEADHQAMVQSNNDVLDLQKEWGSKFNDTIELARRAAQYAMEKAGLTPDQLNTFERSVGTKTMLKMMAEFGNMFREAGAPEVGSSQFSATPEYAKAEINRLQADPEFRMRYMHNDPKIRGEAVRQMEALFKRAYGDAPVT